MNKTLAFALTALTSTGCAYGDGDQPFAGPTNAGPAAQGGVAVVELFTSEGCSSCPPADRALAALVQDAKANHRPIYAIAWHVDYWNRLGWADPFSSAAASARQSQYSDALKLDEVYTPQMIVNGKTQFVGSNTGAASTAIAAALARPAAAEISLSGVRLDGDHVTADYTAANAPAGSVLQVVAVEDGLMSHVARGENGGATLKHENVVRAEQRLALDHQPGGHADLTLPKGVDPSHLTMIAFVQNPSTMAISGASSAAISPAK